MINRPLPVNIDDLLRQRTIEGERVEYKAGWNPEAVLHTLCAFANDFHNLGGGYIVIGVEEENGRPLLPPKGIEPGTIEAIQKEILNLGHHAVQPPYHPLSATYAIEGRTILVLSVPGGETRPYKARVSFARGAKDWAYYLRKQSSTVRATRDDERELVSLAATVPFDDRYNQTASLADLSLRLIEEFLREVGSELAAAAPGLSLEQLGRQMNIVGGPKEAPFPEFESDADRTSFIMRLPLHERAERLAAEPGVQSGVQSGAQSGVQSGAQSGAQSRAQSGAQSTQILSALQAAPRSMSELADALGLRTRTGSLKRTVADLLAAGLIAYTLPDKPGSRLQKYRLTPEGAAALVPGDGRGTDV